MINAASIPEVLRLEAGMARSGLSAARYPIVLYGSVHLPPHPAAQRHVVRGAAENAHGSRLPLGPDVHRPFWSGSVSHANRPRRNVQPYGAVETPREVGSSGKHSTLTPARSWYNTAAMIESANAKPAPRRRCCWITAHSKAIHLDDKHPLL